jgi:hypothetical protein
VAQAVVDPALAALGRVDALLNIAGAVPQIDLFEMTDAQLGGPGARHAPAEDCRLAGAKDGKGRRSADVGQLGALSESPYAAVGTINAAWSRWPRRSRIAASLTACRSTASCRAL